MSVVVTRGGAELLRLDGPLVGGEAAAIAHVAPALWSLNAALSDGRLLAHAAGRAPPPGSRLHGRRVPLARQEAVEALLRALAGHLARKGDLRCPGDPDPEHGVVLHVHLALLVRLAGRHAPRALADAEGDATRPPARWTGRGAALPPCAGCGPAPYCGLGRGPAAGRVRRRARAGLMGRRCGSQGGAIGCTRPRPGSPPPRRASRAPPSSHDDPAPCREAPMSQDPDESEAPRWGPPERYPPAIVALICALCFAAVICVVLALATGRPSFLSLGGAMLGVLAAAVLTRAMQRQAERADAGHDRAKITWVVLKRKRNAALAFALVMTSAVMLVAYFPGSEYGIVLGSILLGAVAGVRFKYPFGL